MSKLTTMDILEIYIQRFKIEAHGKYISNSEMIKVSEFGKSSFNRLHSPMTYERQFRKLRNQLDGAEKFSFRDASKKFPNKKEMVWEVTVKESNLFDG